MESNRCRKTMLSKQFIRSDARELVGRLSGYITTERDGYFVATQIAPNRQKTRSILVLQIVTAQFECKCSDAFGVDSITSELKGQIA